MTIVYNDYSNQNICIILSHMNMEKSTSDLPSDIIVANTPDSWVWVYRIVALVTLWVAWYGAIKYTTDPQVSASIDEMINKMWISYTTLMTDIENPGTRRVTTEPKNTNCK